MEQEKADCPLTTSIANPSMKIYLHSICEGTLRMGRAMDYVTVTSELQKQKRNAISSHKNSHLNNQYRRVF